MGTGISVRSDVESSSGSGQKSVVAGPFDEYGDKDALFDQILNVARDLAEPMDRFVLRSLECIEEGPDKVTVKVQKDGRKMNCIRLQDGSVDPEVESLVTRYNREQGMIVHESGKTGKGQIEVFSFLNDPLRLEFRMEVGNTQNANDAAATRLQCKWLPAIERLSKGTVRVWDGVDSPSGAGKSTMSDPLDAHFTYGDLFRELVGELRVPPEGWFVVSSKDLEDGGHEQRISNANVIMTFTHRSEPASGTVVVEAKQGSVPLVDMHYAIHRDPLRVESWFAYDHGRVRLGGCSVGNELQGVVNALVAKTQRPCHVL